MNPSHLWLMGLLGVMLHATPALAQQNLPIIDAHSQFDQNVPNEKIVAVIEQAGVSRVLLATRGGESVESRALALARARPDLISVLVASKWDRYQRTDQFVPSFVQRAENPAFAGMAEMLVTHAPHDHPQLKFAGLQIPLDSPQIKAGIRVARQHGWPLILHLEFVDMGDDAAQQYLAALEKLLRENRDLPVGLIHMGQLNQPKVAALLAANENLFFLTSQADNTTAMLTRRMIERGMKAQTEWINMFAGRALRPEWKEEMIRHPDRFVLAFDNVFPPNWSEQYTRKVAAWRDALLDLPPEVAHKVAHGNAERLWRLPPASN